MSNNGAGKPVVSLDLDGTLGDYHGHFLRFAEGWFGRPMPDAFKINPQLKLWEFMEVPHAKYQQCKLAYRSGGMKRTMPAYPGVEELTWNIQHAGAEVWICTTRPFQRMDNIDPDTQEWLRRNDIHYDALLFDTLEGKGSKYDELKRQAGDRVASILEDLPELIEHAYSLRIMGCQEPIMMEQPYNVTDPWPVKVRTMDEAWIKIEHQIKVWRGLQNA